MTSGWVVTFELNAYLAGCLVLLVIWLIVLSILHARRMRDDIAEIWWASFSCAWLGITEPLFVPEYWTPPSILKFHRWDLESFVFCFAVGGLSAVLTELPSVRRALMALEAAFLWRVTRAACSGLERLTAGQMKLTQASGVLSSRLVLPDQLRLENMLLVTVFLAMFGATSQFGLNIIYDCAIVCVVTAGFIWWRRPNLRWQIVGGGLSFTVIYTVVLLLVGWWFPGFYDHWNLDALSGRWFLGAPVEEYLFAFTFGILWAPLYEASRDERNRASDAPQLPN